MTRILTPAAVIAALLVAPGCKADDGETYGKRPDWSVTVDGKKVSAKDYDGKVLIVDFWATWCPPCRKEIPGFIALKKQYEKDGLEIVGFSFDRDKATHDKWVKDQGVNYLSVFAQTPAGMKVIGEFQKNIGEIRGIPTTLVIDRKGTIVFKHVGLATKERFEEVIKPLLAKK